MLYNFQSLCLPVGLSKKYMQKTQERRQMRALTDVCWMLIDLCLPEFDAYQSAIARSCFKSHTNC